MERKYKITKGRDVLWKKSGFLLFLHPPSLLLNNHQIVDRFAVSNSQVELGMVRFVVAPKGDQANTLFEIKNDISGTFGLFWGKGIELKDFFENALPVIEGLNSFHGSNSLTLFCEDGYNESYSLNGKGVLFRVVQRTIEELRENNRDALNLKHEMRDLKAVIININNILLLHWGRGKEKDKEILVAGDVTLWSNEKKMRLLSEWLAKSSKGKITPGIVKEVFNRLPFSSQDGQNSAVH